MKVFLFILGVLLLVGPVVVVTSGHIYPRYSWKYKITVEIETPEGIKTGSAVRQISNSAPSIFKFPESGNPADVRGEAVVVDLGERGVLFALISSDSDMEFYSAFRELWPRGGSTPEAIAFYSKMSVGTKGVLSPSKWPGYPELVTFTDINDPKSATLVQEWKTGNRSMILKEDHMEKLFGEGVKLKAITLEISDEPVTWGVVEKLLPWLSVLNGGYLHGGFTAKGAPLGLHGGNFQRDLSKN